MADTKSMLANLNNLKLKAQASVQSDNVVIDVPKVDVDYAALLRDCAVRKGDPTKIPGN